MSDLIFDGDTDLLADYLRWLANEVGLRDWVIHLAGDTPVERGGEAEFGAMCEVVPGQKRAVISVARDWSQQRPEDFRLTCLHELIHCHLDPLEKPLEHAKAMLGLMAHTPLHQAYHYALEVAIDSMAYEWARHLPLPHEWLERVTGPGGEAA